ncbi:DUF397 domain-containing protein [Streptomyces fagopyri]|uniref:DUF397 domain-containing protein n=1 Tax=Streptomyces fagopyri TaxID=2662397 RepID=UPI0033C2E066
MSTSELTWFKSTFSSGGSGDCLEVAVSPRTVHVRDSKNPQGPRLTLSPVTWSDFLTFAVTHA